ncbi:MAG: hypothetical protein QGI45_10835 [Myxococcota bacterium]|jgi:hypothetical protein|nr:hypothetical protein [Myxococcota bacterium]
MPKKDSVKCQKQERKIHRASVDAASLVRAGKAVPLRFAADQDIGTGNVLGKGLGFDADQEVGTGEFKKR